MKNSILYPLPPAVHVVHVVILSVFHPFHVLPFLAMLVYLYTQLNKNCCQYDLKKMRNLLTTIDVIVGII
jgi:hypothetical protein